MDETQDIFHKDKTVLNYMENRQQIKIALSPLLKIRSSAKLWRAEVQASYVRALLMQIKMN